MQMITIDNSSNVAAIGHEPSVNLLRVQYRDGRTYDFEDVSPDKYASLVAAPSKGRWLAANVKNGMELLAEIEFEDSILPLELQVGIDLASPEGDKSVTTIVPLPDLREPEPRPTLNTFEPDDCCGPRLSKVSDLNAINTWTCSKCGEEWRPDLIDGIRHWSAMPFSDVW